MAIVSTQTYFLRPNRVELVEQDDEGLMWISLGEELNDTIRYVTLSRNIGESTIYAERDDQAWSGYDPLRSLTLSKRQLTILLNELGAKRLGVERIVIDGSLINTLQWQQLTDLLASLFAGTIVACSLDS